jgi:hypothetical protein
MIKDIRGQAAGSTGFEILTVVADCNQGDCCVVLMPRCPAITNSLCFRDSATNIGPIVRKLLSPV